jgi:hypothetical protein
MDELRTELEVAKKEIVNVAAETLALQAILVALINRMKEAKPELTSSLLGAFDDAASSLEHISIMSGRASGHTPRSLQIVEELRTAVADQANPKHGV